MQKLQKDQPGYKAKTKKQRKKWKKEEQGKKNKSENRPQDDKIAVILPIARANNIEIGLKRVSGSVAAIREMILTGDAAQLGAIPIEES